SLHQIHRDDTPLPIICFLSASLLYVRDEDLLPFLRSIACGDSASRPTNPASYRRRRTAVTADNLQGPPRASRVVDPRGTLGRDRGEGTKSRRLRSHGSCWQIRKTGPDLLRRHRSNEKR